MKEDFQMKTPQWNKELSEVLGHETVPATLLSSKGTEYETEVIRELKVKLSGGIEATDDGKFKYPVYDETTDFNFTIKVANSINANFNTVLLFKVVRGGPTNNGGWYAADTVEVYRNEKTS